MKRIVVVGMARSGTACVAKLAEALGLDARHQDLPGPRDWELYPYDLDAPPAHVAGRARHFAWAAPEFNASWGLSYYIRLMQRENPDLAFLIATRPAQLVCNSLMNYRQRVEDRRPNPIAYFVKQYIECYEFLCEQVERMDPRPRFYDAEALFHGDYNDRLLELFGVTPTEATRRLIRRSLAAPVNRHGEYAHEWCAEMPLADEKKRLLEHLCPEL